MFGAPVVNSALWKKKRKQHLFQHCKDRDCKLKSVMQKTVEGHRCSTGRMNTYSLSNDFLMQFGSECSFISNNNEITWLLLNNLQYISTSCNRFNIFVQVAVERRVVSQWAC